MVKGQVPSFVNEVEKGGVDAHQTEANRCCLFAAVFY